MGITELGENRVQELIAKLPLVKGAVNWHLIGHLQTNKVRQIIDKVKLIHSVDSLRLAEEIDVRARQKNLSVDILIEINIGNEESKHGIQPDETTEFYKKLLKLENIKVCGLMTVAPYVENPEDNRVCFQKMRELFIDIKQSFHDNRDMKYLSMGMSNDYVVAIEEGANMVRIGTGIFGGR